MSLPTPTVSVPPWLRVTSYLALDAPQLLRGGDTCRRSYCAEDVRNSPDSDPEASQRIAADCLA